MCLRVILTAVLETCVNGVIPLVLLTVTIMSFEIDVLNTFTIFISNASWILWKKFKIIKGFCNKRVKLLWYCR